MQIERTDHEIIIRVASNTDLTGLQRILDYVKFREIASKSKADSQDINDISKTSKLSWWEKNKSRFDK